MKEVYRRTILIIAVVFMLIVLNFCTFKAQIERIATQMQSVIPFAGLFGKNS